MEEDIGYPRYLIGATGEGAVSLRPDPAQPRPLRQLIFLHRNNDIVAWFLATHAQDPLNLVVVESRPDNGEDGAQTPDPANGRYPFLNRKIWDDPVGAMQADKDEDGEGDEDENEDGNADEDEGEAEWLAAESEEEPQAPANRGETQASTPGREPQMSAREGTIVLHDVSIDT